MIFILVGCHAQTHRVAFGDDRGLAETELAALKERMGHDRWGKNGKGDDLTHTLKCPTGDVVVVLEKIEIARLIDEDKDAELHQPLNDQAFDRAMERSLKYRRALAAEGFDTKAADLTA